MRAWIYGRSDDLKKHDVVRFFHVGSEPPPEGLRGEVEISFIEVLPEDVAAAWNKAAKAAEELREKYCLLRAGPGGHGDCRFGPTASGGCHDCPAAVLNDALAVLSKDNTEVVREERSEKFRRGGQVKVIPVVEYLDIQGAMRKARNILSDVFYHLNVDREEVRGVLNQLREMVGDEANREQEEPVKIIINSDSVVSVVKVKLDK